MGTARGLALGSVVLAASFVGLAGPAAADTDNGTCIAVSSRDTPPDTPCLDVGSGPMAILNKGLVLGPVQRQIRKEGRKQGLRLSTLHRLNLEQRKLDRLSTNRAEDEIERQAAKKQRSRTKSDMLACLAGGAVAALPGVIGMIVQFIADGTVSVGTLAAALTGAIVGCVKKLKEVRSGRREIESSDKSGDAAAYRAAPTFRATPLAGVRP
jgi:hypothetical protein